MRFRITGLAAEPFQPLFGLSDAELARHGARRCVADAKSGFPDRIGLRDAERGEPLILVNFTHHDAPTPYRASHAIFVAQTPQATYDRVDEIPQPLLIRPISLRAFDEAGDMVDADLADGPALEGAIRRLLADPRAAFVHAHFAKRGCHAARIDRA